MNDTLTIPITPSVVLTVADLVASPAPDDALSDDDLEQSVGGLARTWNGVAPSLLDVGTSYTIAQLDARDITQRISA
jgi:hypothetical protein